MNVGKLQQLNFDVWMALAGSDIDQWRIDQIADALDRQHAEMHRCVAENRRAEQLVTDLRAHLKDRERYIKLLESDVLERQKSDPGEQGSIL